MLSSISPFSQISKFSAILWNCSNMIISWGRNILTEWTCNLIPAVEYCDICRYVYIYILYETITSEFQFLAPGDTVNVVDINVPFILTFILITEIIFVLLYASARRMFIICFVNFRHLLSILDWWFFIILNLDCCFHHLFVGILDNAAGERQERIILYKTN